MRTESNRQFPVTALLLGLPLTAAGLGLYLSDEKVKLNRKRKQHLVTLESDEYDDRDIMTLPEDKLEIEKQSSIRLNKSLEGVVGASQLPANNPIEDRILADVLTTADGKELALLAVIDGHGGWYVADYVQRNLLKYVQKFITDNSINSTDTDSIADAMPHAFMQLDTDMKLIVKNYTDMYLSRAAKVGACCLCSIVTPLSIVTANIGDCEGQIMSRGGYVPLAEPHSANEPTEQDRLLSQYSEDPGILRCKREVTVGRLPKTKAQYILYRMGILGTETRGDCCYIKGRLMPTRCFGDWHLKDQEFSYDHEHDRPLVMPPYRFPYISAVPEVFSIRRRFAQKRMMIASDGVYDFLNQAEVSEALKVNGGAAEAALAVVESTFDSAAMEAALTKEELKDLPFKEKRRKHDDTSVIVCDIAKIRARLYPSMYTKIASYLS